MSVKKACVLAVLSVLLVPGALADPAPTPTGKPDVATLLFETPQWSKAPVGTKLTYAYSKKTDAAYGQSFDDTIMLALDKGDEAQMRTVDVKMFSGAHVKAAGPFASDEQNPVLLLALEANIEDLSKVWDANPRYLKNAIRKAWRDDAKIEGVQLEVSGKTVPGTRITVEPFRASDEKDKMKGLETMIYTIEIADSVPGNIVAIDVHGPATGTPTFSETLRYQSESTR